MNPIWLIMYVLFIFTALVIFASGMAVLVDEVRKKLKGNGDISWLTIAVYVFIILGIVSGVILVV